MVVPPDQARFLFGLLQAVDTLADAEMVPVALFPDIAAQCRDLFKGRNQRPAVADRRQAEQIGLPLEIADKVSENKAKIDQHEEQQRHGDRPRSTWYPPRYRSPAPAC